MPDWLRIQAMTSLSTSVTMNMRSASLRCAMEMIEMRGLPSGVNSSRCASSGSPCIQVAKPGEAMQVVDLHRELEAVFRGKEGFEIEGAELVEGRLLHGLDEAGHVERQPGAPCAFEDVGEQDVFARTDGVRFDAQQAQQARHHRADAIAQRTGVGQQLGRGRRKRPQHRQRQPGLGARRVDSHVGGGAQLADALGRLIPFGQAFLPRLGRLRRESSRSRPCARLRRHPPTARSRAGARFGKRQHADCRGRPWDRCRSPGRRRWRLLRAATGTGPSCRCPSCPRRPREW